MNVTQLDESALFPDELTHFILATSRTKSSWDVPLDYPNDVLSSPCLTTIERLEAIEETNLPECLDAMYEKILRLISKSSSRSKLLAQRISHG